MAHNRSPEKVRRDALAHPASAYTGHLLDLTCRCRARRTLRVTDLAALDPAATLGAVLARLRCAACRQPPTDVVLIAVTETVRLPLRGQGCRY